MKYKNPRPTTKPITAVMLEFLGESNEWEWYDILFDCTPYEAVLDYLKVNDEDCVEKFEISFSNYMDKIEHVSARAYYITI